MSTTTVRLLTAVAVLTLMSLVPARATEAGIITLDFTGTYDTGSQTVFGEKGSAVPFSYSITYDTSLSGAGNFLLAGSSVGGAVTAEDIYGYSKDGIIALSATFGTHTFTPDMLRRTEIFTGVGADIWFNTNLDSAAPTKVWAWFNDGFNNLFIGGINFGFSTIAFSNKTTINEAGSSEVAGTYTMSQDSPTTVPEPTSMLLLGTGLLALAARVRRTHGQK